MGLKQCLTSAGIVFQYVPQSRLKKGLVLCQKDNVGTNDYLPLLKGMFSVECGEPEQPADWLHSDCASTQPHTQPHTQPPTSHAPVYSAAPIISNQILFLFNV